MSILAACKKYVDPGLPKTQLRTTSVFTSPATANAAVLALFSQQASLTSMGLSQNVAFVADELTNYSSDATYTARYKNNLNSSIADNWNNFYKIIYQANLILENINAAPLSQALKNQIEGEAKFVRSFNYFYLVNLYGNVPLTTITDYNINASLKRAPISEVYKQIATDLESAKSLLNVNFVGADGLTTTTQRLRPNKSSASALLARVYLYLGQYDKAELEATNVINNTTFALETDLSRVFLSASKEAIFQITEGGTLNTWFGDYVLTTNPSLCSLSESLVAEFEPGDNRKATWVNYYSTFPYSNKYRARRNTAPQTELIVVLRLAEQYLIRAEAKIQQDRIQDGIADLNIVRSRARQTPTLSVPNPLPGLSLTMSKSDALLTVEKERRVELFLEWGDRWFNMKRTGRINDIMTAYAPVKNTTWSSYKQLFPIQQTELLNNPNLVQNMGY